MHYPFVDFSLHGDLHPILALSTPYCRLTLTPTPRPSPHPLLHLGWLSKDKREWGRGMGFLIIAFGCVLCKSAAWIRDLGAWVHLLTF